MVWPFTRAKPPGWVNNEVPTHTQLNLMDEQIAQAADGSIWTDLVLLSNLFPLELDSGPLAGSVLGQALLWEPTLRRWWSFGKTSTDVSYARYSEQGTYWSNGTLHTDAPATTWGGATQAATNGIGTIVVGGQVSGVAAKVRYSLNGGVNWGSGTMSVSAGEYPEVVRWMPSAGLFVAGRGDTFATNIETSPTGAIWTQRTGPNANSRRDGAASASIAVLISSSGTDKCVSSSDGITWTERTLPSVGNWTAIAWSEQRQKFMAIATGGAVAVSADGITWSSAGLTAPPSAASIAPGGLQTYGRLWLAACGNTYSASLDDGVTWRALTSIVASAGNMKFAVSARGQALFVTGPFGDTIRRSLIGGV